MGAVAGQRIQMRRAEPGLRLHEAEGVVAVVVGEDEDDVAAAAVAGLAEEVAPVRSGGGRLQKVPSRTGEACRTRFYRRTLVCGGPAGHPTSVLLK